MESLLNDIQGNWIVYALVFLAIVLPVVLWRRDESAGSAEEAGWRSLPPVFRFLWGAAVLLEFPLGLPIARMREQARTKYEKWILASGGLPLTPARVFAVQVLLALVGAALGSLVMLIPDVRPLWGVLLAIGLGFVGWVYPPTSLAGYVEWRQTEITRALPFAIDLMGSAMRAGLEFGAALRYFVELKMPGPLTEDFGKVLQQMDLGKTRTEALAEMARKVQIEAFTSFVGVIAYGTEIGASISETLRVHGEELRRARFHLAERKAQRAPSLMILPMAVFIMPAVFIIIITPVIMKMSGTGIAGH